MEAFVLFCKVCEVRVAAEKQFTVTQHVGRKKHLCALEINRKSEVVQTLFNTVPKNNCVFIELKNVFKVFRALFDIKAFFKA